MRPGKGPAACLFASLWIAFGAGAPPQARTVYPSRTGAAIPGLEAIESRLLELTNAERQANGLKPVRQAAILVDAARRHSLDMAAHRVLSHLSSNGRTLEDRLVAAGAYFSADGENVALSSPPSPEAVHKSLMDSPGHRENILNQGFDSVGIGAEESADGTLFVTEDFTTRIVVLGEEEAARQAALVVRDIRKEHGVPPVIWDVRAGSLARTMAERQAAGRGLGEIPAALGEVRVLVVESAFFRDLDKYKDDIGNQRCPQAGLGVVFRRTRENPGGVYVMVLVLVAERPAFR